MAWPHWNVWNARIDRGDAEKSHGAMDDDVAASESKGSKPMVFGYSTNAFVKYSLLDSFDMIARLGFAGVEIMCDQPHLYPPEYDAAALTNVKASHGEKRTEANQPEQLHPVCRRATPTCPPGSSRRPNADGSVWTIPWQCLEIAAFHRMPQYLGAAGRTAAQRA